MELHKQALKLQVQHSRLLNFSFHDGWCMCVYGSGGSTPSKSYKKQNKKGPRWFMNIVLTSVNTRN